jgi:hypothetical protein
MNRSTLCALLVILLLLSPHSSFADTKGSIRGRAWDATGAVVVGANVRVENLIDGEVWTGQTNDRGEYEIDFIRAGHYRIRAEAKGFQPILPDKLLRVADGVGKARGTARLPVALLKHGPAVAEVSADNAALRSL